MNAASSTKVLLLIILLSMAGLPFASYAGMFCGDGNVDTETIPPEECDEGDIPFSNLCNNTTDQFDGPCQFTICGDSVVQAPNGEGFTEECDPPEAGVCDDTCTFVTTTTSTTPTTTTTGPATTTTTGPVTTTTTGTATTTTATPTTTTATPTTTTATPTTTTTMAAVTTTTTTAATTTTAVPTTTTTTLPVISACGDGNLDVGESCDDGNTTDGDGCTATCQTETVTVDLPNDVKVTVTTSDGQSLTNVSVDEATGGPSGVSFPLGIISYTTSVLPGESATTTLRYSDDLPVNTVVYKVDDGGNYTKISNDINRPDHWTKVDPKTVAVTLTDGGNFDLDGDPTNGSIRDPIAVGGEAIPPNFDSSGGCTLSTGPRVSVDPIWLFLLVAPGVGYLRRRIKALRVS